MAKRSIDEALLQLIDMVRDLALDGIDAPSRFLIDADIIADLVVVTKKITMDKSLNKGLNVKLTEVMTRLVQDMGTLTRSDEIVIRDALTIAEEQHNWKEALDKFYGVIEEV